MDHARCTVLDPGSREFVIKEGITISRANATHYYGSLDKSRVEAQPV